MVASSGPASMFSESSTENTSPFRRLAVRIRKTVQILITSPPQKPHSQTHLTGLRGILVLESFLWILIQTFLPGLTAANLSSPAYQQGIRKGLQVLFWDYSFIASFFLILSARAICVPFLTESSSTNYARSLIRRPIEVGLPLFVAVALAYIIFNRANIDVIGRFATDYRNSLVQPVSFPSTRLALVNSIYNTLWIVRDFSNQAANRAWPSMTLWSPSLIYFQSYTVYIAMVILPFTRPRWHIRGLSLFIIAAWWMNSWGWYSATGLMLADISIDPILQADFQRGFQVTKKFYVANGLIGAILVAGGLAAKYVWIAARPDLEHLELASRPSLQLSDNFSVEKFDTTRPYPRMDNYLLVVGILLLIEAFGQMQKFLAGNRTLVFLGKRSFSFFTAQSCLVYTVGMRLALHLRTVHGLSIASTNAITIGTLVPAVLLGAEVFHRLVDVPSRHFAEWVFVWLRK